MGLKEVKNVYTNITSFKYNSLIFTDKISEHNLPLRHLNPLNASAYLGHVL